MLRIQPRAANAFDVELLQWNNKEYVVIGTLEFHNDGKRLHILNRSGDIEIKTHSDVGNCSEDETITRHTVTLIPKERKD